MSIRATSLVYSSHNCGYDLHYTWMIRRALETPNKRILYLPFSEAPTRSGDDYERQQFGYSKFEWYFARYKHQGLNYAPFYWSKSLTHEDAATFFDMLRNYDVVVFGGGNPALGMRRYRDMGARFFGDPDMVCKIVHDRQRDGLLTCGFSAGADQLAEVMSETAWGETVRGFGLSSRIAVTLHHESGRDETLIRGARKDPGVLWFGLPNDSGMASQQGNLPSGRWWQVLETVIDKTWDIPEDAFHIKTRYGAGVDHYYADGRHWSFHNGDQIVRISGPGVEECFIVSGGKIYDYQSQNVIGHGNAGDILGQF